MIKQKRKTFADEVNIIVQHELNQLPFPQKATIKKVYDNNYADIEVNNQILPYVECIGTPVPGNTAILIFLNGDINDYILLTR